MAELLFGTGGTPLSTEDRSPLAGLKRIRELDLDLMELEFVHGVRMSVEMAKAMAKTGREKKVALTVHGPYYVNLASENNKIFYGSVQYIADSLLIGSLAGARSVTFHPGFYQKASPEETMVLVDRGIGKIYEKFAEKIASLPLEDSVNLEKPEIKSPDSGIKMAPELTGKPTQFGDLEELVELCRRYRKNDLRFCFDFAHKFARSNGKFNTYDEFMQMLGYIEKHLGKEFLSAMHIHVSAIMHSEKGEKNHVTMLASNREYVDAGVDLPAGEKIITDLQKKNKVAGSLFNWRDLLRALKTSGAGGYLVCESPCLEMDALLMKKYYASL